MKQVVATIDVSLTVHSLLPSKMLAGRSLLVYPYATHPNIVFIATGTFFSAFEPALIGSSFLTLVSWGKVITQQNHKCFSVNVRLPFRKLKIFQMVELSLVLVPIGPFERLTDRFLNTRYIALDTDRSIDTFEDQVGDF